MNSGQTEGATPLDPNETAGLLLTHLTTREELNYWEQQNINEAEQWAFARRQTDLLSQKFICRLHKKMFGNVWKWAGRFRNSYKNIGIDPWQIATETASLCENTRTWITHATYQPDEIAVRFHHRLVQIHPFPNGNGRHARLMTDLIVKQILHQPLFNWGSENLTSPNETRKKYINALQVADRQLDFAPLLEFVRS
ncbi:MAG: mobile mystery protein B [Desulfobulbaceae bacterium]|nr:mobile mystery protein B [Desulfobulbaceae bacterium]